jgi:CubicO group peptidase (beta-lactamase class C family)
MINRIASYLILFPAAILTTSAALRAQAPPPSTVIAPLLQPFVDSHTLAGVVTLVANKEKTLSLEAVGFADIAANTPMHTDDLFWIASMSKPMTATALMMLVDEGKVNVDDPVEKYLPEFKGQMVAVEQDKDHILLKHPAHPITVKNILTHTSGLPPLSRVEHQIDTLSLHEAVISYAMSPLRFEPGAKYQYCNAGINSAGRIIEVVSGMPFEEFMEQRLIKPLGMKDTTFWPTEEQMHRLAKSYKPNAAKNGLDEIPIDQLTYPLTNPKRGPSPAGGYFSTAADVAQFGRMILNGGALDGKRYVSQAAVRQMTSTQTSDLPINGKNESGYGFGWSTNRSDPSPTPPFGHGGAYATDLRIDPQHQLVTVFMVQHAGFPGPDGGKIRPTFIKAAVDTFGK